jgi:hypothetical protein
MSQTAGERESFRQRTITELEPSGCRGGEKTNRQVERRRLFRPKLGRQVCELEKAYMRCGLITPVFVVPMVLLTKPSTAWPNTMLRNVSLRPSLLA